MEKKQVLIVTNEMSDEEIIQIRQSLSKEEAKQSPIKLTLVHVIPRLPACYFSIPTIGVLVEKYYDDAKHTLTQIGKHLGIAQKDQWLISGKMRTEVLRLATKLGSHFILASAKQIQELQRSLFFKNIHQYAMIKHINQLKLQ